MSNVIADYVITLGMNNERELYRVKKDWVIRFKLTDSLIGKDVRFFTNYPSYESDKFVRKEYQEISLIQPTPNLKKIDRFDNFFELGPVVHSGAFHFAFTTDESPFKYEMLKTHEFYQHGGSGYFVVDSRFSLPGSPSSEISPLYIQWDLEGVILQTVLAKNLGYFKDWKGRLRVSKESGYNMIHFSPLQELGISKSGYSLKDQLTPSSSFAAPGEAAIEWSQIKNFIDEMENDWNMMSITDLVLNHTAINSPWLLEHPECGYNLKNSPHLIPAFLVDYTIWKMNDLCAAGKLNEQGIVSDFATSEDHVHNVRSYLAEELKMLNLHEFYQANIEAVCADYKKWISDGGIDTSNVFKDEVLTLRIAGPRAGKRMGGTVDFACAKQAFNDASEMAMQGLADILTELNRSVVDICMHHIWCAVDCVANGIRYRFFDPKGPCIKLVTTNTPLVEKYFIWPDVNLSSVKDAEDLALSDKGAMVLACNGWVMNADPLKNFADVDSDVYVRRDLVVWGDSCKLRYGEGPEDCPYLWSHMMEYSKKMASIFHGVRLDNAHSTPIHVAQAILDACRMERPNIYILAELFTGNEGTDNIFINRLGISSLVREALSAFDCHDEGRMVHRFGGLQPAGAFPHSVLKRRLLPTLPHAIFCDQTHDNPAPALKRTVFDYVPSASLIAMSACDTGSVRGYDELVPYMIDVVTEDRCYASWDQEVDQFTGMITTKAALNKLHKWMGKNRFVETFVDQVDTNVIATTRFCPDTAESIVMFSHSSFYEHNDHPPHVGFKRVTLNGRIRRVILAAKTINQASGHALQGFERDPKYINGLKNVEVKIEENIPIEENTMFNIINVDEAGGSDAIEFFDFPPGSIVAISISLTDAQAEALSRIRGSLLHQFGHRLRSNSLGPSDIVDADTPSDNLLPTFPETISEGHVKQLISNLSMIDINYLMYRCEREENCCGINRRPYFISNFGDLVYCGLQGVMSVLQKVAEENDLGHPLCAHLRDGLWLQDYLLNRISEDDVSHPSKALSELAKCLQELFIHMYTLPRYLVPLSFGMVYGCLHQQITDELASRLGNWTVLGSSTVRHLAIATVQFYGKAPNTKLPEILPAPCFGSQSKDNPDRYTCSLAAGLPHFAEGMWRSWGRDSFVALRGCLMLTERFDEAAISILQFSSLLRHGLIPNLMGDGSVVAPRYNARDAVWWWLYAITTFEDAVAMHEKKSLGVASSIINQPVYRWFPTDETEGWPKEAGTVDLQAMMVSDRVQPLCNLMLEALQRHVKGIEFRERKAGHELDCQMQNDGFNITAGIATDTGFPSGGNKMNCGTWMDKMGSSDKAGNKGIPASPRDGSAVELVGLAYAVINWLDSASKVGGYFPHKGVKLENGSEWTWADWAKKIRDNFENKFFIPETGTYKDLYGSHDIENDKMFRPNFLIAMTVAPDLFSADNAWKSLEAASKALVGRIGMRTLDPMNSFYRGYYNTNDDSNDYFTGQGFNYHNGPEWVWLTGFYIRARLATAQRLVDIDQSNIPKRAQAVRECQEIFFRMEDHIRGSPWRSLPELTNANGDFCHGSCPTQAWSVGCAVEAMYDLLNIVAPELDKDRAHHRHSHMAGSSGSRGLGSPTTDGEIAPSEGMHGAKIRVSIAPNHLRILCNVS